MAKNNIEIIYEDQQIIAVNKPAGISVTADRTGKINLPYFLQIQTSASSAEPRREE